MTNKSPIPNIQCLLIIIFITFFIPSDSFAAKGIAKKIEDKIGLDENATSQERVDAVGQRIAKVSDRKDIVYTFKVLKGEDINAFALPDGYIYIFKGLLDKIKTDDELASVLAHEIGHIAARHHDKRMTRSILTELFRIEAVTSADTNQDKYNISMALGELMLSYSRDEEIEADRLSAIYLKRAGYNPVAVISVIEILMKSQMEGPIKPKRYWRTHPYLSDRIRAAREEISGNIIFTDYINTPTEGVEH